MQDHSHLFRKVGRICCVVHHRLSHRVTQRLAEMGVDPIFIESGRNVRRVVRKRHMGFPGLKRRLHNTPVEFIYATVSRDRTHAVLESLIDAAELHTPGRGSIYAQDIIEYGGGEPVAADNTPTANAPAGRDGNTHPALLTDLSCITAILSMPGSGEQCAQMALELGTCVPLVTLGAGTGMRDRLGLLRITIPPEKEVVRLLVPEYDSGSIMQLLIEGMRLNRPGSGYIYGAPVKAGLLDARLNIGFQESAASMEQIIAAIDQLKSGTAWRKRFADIEPGRINAGHRLMDDRREITVNCLEGALAGLVAAAMEAGAGGATTFRLRRLLAGDDDSGSAARESAIINVPAPISSQVIQAILDANALDSDTAGRIQVLEVPMAFNYRRGR